MRVYELRYPGMRIDFSDEKTDWEIYSSIGDIEHSFTEAAVALNLFESERKRDSEALHKRIDIDSLLKDREEQSNKLAELSKKYEAQNVPEIKTLSNFEQSQAIRALAEIELKREKWNSGVLPREYEHSLISIYVKAFVSALYMIGKSLNVLCEEYKDLPQEVNNQKMNFLNAFPQLKDIRDSLQHEEDRGRGLNKNGQPLNIKPGVKGNIKTVGNSLVLNNIHGDKFGTTINDGRFVEIEVNDQTMKIVQQCIQGIIDSFKWKGFASYYPN